MGHAANTRLQISHPCGRHLNLHERSGPDISRLGADAPAWGQVLSVELLLRRRLAGVMLAQQVCVQLVDGVLPESGESARTRRLLASGMQNRAADKSCTGSATGAGPGVASYRRGMMTPRMTFHPHATAWCAERVSAVVTSSVRDGRLLHRSALPGPASPLVAASCSLRPAVGDSRATPCLAMRVGVNPSSARMGSEPHTSDRPMAPEGERARAATWRQRMEVRHRRLGGHGNMGGDGMARWWVEAWAGRWAGDYQSCRSL